MSRGNNPPPSVAPTTASFAVSTRTSATKRTGCHVANLSFYGLTYYSRDIVTYPARCQEELLSDSSQSLLELVHATACIDKLLLAGVEGMALGADFNTHLATLGRARNDSLTACALDDALNVLGMDSVLHFHIPLTWNFPICLDMGYKSLYIIAYFPLNCKGFLKFFIGNFH